ncbi:MAG: glycosyltransferase family 39 protein [Actinobacteria bacterium]|nr:glycosyltransferase family 39 protein [Actinomycetota bacterium]
MTELDGRRFRILIGVATGIGLALRGWWVSYATRTPQGLFDMARYLGYGKAIADGKGYIEFTGYPTAYYPPGYPYFAGVVTWLSRPFTDDATMPIALTQALLGVLTIVLVAYVARRTAGRAVAVVAAFVYAIYPNLVMHTGIVLGETLNIFLTFVFVAIVVRRPMGEEQRWPWMLGAGVALGLGLLVRPVTGALLLVLVGVWWLARRDDRGSVLRSTGFVVVGIGLCVAPWIVRNAIRMDAFVPMSTNTGDNLCIGYQPDANGSFTLSENCAIGDPFQGPASEIATDQEKTDYALEQIRDDPGRVPWLVWKRTDYTWVKNGDHDAVTWAQDFYTNPWMPKPTRDRIIWWSDAIYWSVLASGAVGLVILVRRRRPEGVLLVGSFLTTAILPLAFFGESRFKVPAVPFLVIASAVALVAAADAVRGQSRRLSSTSREITGASRPVP